MRVAHNRRHGRRDVALFEIGARFTTSGGERRGRGAGVDRQLPPSTGRAPDASVDFFDAQGCRRAVLCRRLGVTPSFTAVRLPCARPWAGGVVVVANGQRIGVVGQLLPALAERAGAPTQDAVLVAELDLDRIDSAACDAPPSAVTPLPRHPFVVRDISIVVADALPAEIIRGTIQTAGDGLAAPLVAIAFFDRYQGKGVPEGSISLSIRLTFQAPDRTLTDAEVQNRIRHDSVGAGSASTAPCNGDTCMAKTAIHERRARTDRSARRETEAPGRPGRAAEVGAGRAAAEENQQLQDEVESLRDA